MVAALLVLLATRGGILDNLPPLMHRRGVADDDIRVLVTGATGRTGSLVYKQLKTLRAVKEVRAFVTSADKARDKLGCDRCDISEGIYVGNVTNRADLVVAAAGVNTVIITVGASPMWTVELQRAVEYGGVVNTAAGIGGNKASLQDMRIVLISSMGAGSSKRDAKALGENFIGDILFYKLQAEAFLGQSGIPSVIIKPCGLVDADVIQRGTRTLLVGHDDELLPEAKQPTTAKALDASPPPSLSLAGDLSLTLAGDLHDNSSRVPRNLSTSPPLPPPPPPPNPPEGGRRRISRADVAAIAVAAVELRAANLRFDVCSREGAPTTDLRALLHGAAHPWQQGQPYPRSQKRQSELVVVAPGLVVDTAWYV